MFMGIESINQDSLKSVDKQNSAKLYEEMIKRIHDQGIDIHAGFICGLDHEDVFDFERTAEWATKMGLAGALWRIMTPYPGTKQFAELKAAGRILTENWTAYTGEHVVYKPAKMTVEQLYWGHKWAKGQVLFISFHRTAGDPAGVSERVRRATQHYRLWTGLSLHVSPGRRFGAGECLPRHEPLAAASGTDRLSIPLSTEEAIQLYHGPIWIKSARKCNLDRGSINVEPRSGFCSTRKRHAHVLAWFLASDHDAGPDPHP